MGFGVRLGHMGLGAAQLRNGRLAACLLGAPWTTPLDGWLVRVLMMEVRNQGLVHNPPGRNPRSLLRTISLPVHQVLEASAPSSGTKQSSDGVHWASIHNTRGRRWWYLRNQRAFMNWFEPGNVERRMYPHGPWQLESDCRWVDDSLNGKWTDEPGCQLA